MRYQKNNSRILYDPPLTLNGKEHSYNTGKTISTICGKPIHYIYSSPFTRCLETSIQVCNAIEQIQGMECLIRIEYSLTECLGPWHDYQKYFNRDSIIIDDVMDVSFINKRYPNRIDLSYKSITKRQDIRNYETPETAFIRNAIFYREVIKNHPSNLDIILITHSSAFMSFVIQWTPYSEDYKYKLGRNKVILPKNTRFKTVTDFLDKRRKMYRTGGKKTGILAISYRSKKKWITALDKPVKIIY